MRSYLGVVYDANTRPHTAYPAQLAEYFIERFGLEEGGRFLDVGCGRGDFMKAFNGAGFDVIGVDIEKLESAVLDGTEVLQVDIEKENLPFDDNSFDIVFSKSVLEHVSNPEHFFREQLRVLKPGGKIFCLTPDWMTQMKIFYNDHTHKKPYTKEGLRKALTISGFQEVRCELFYQLPLIWKYPSLKIIARLLQILGPVNKLHKNKFIRWSRELMILGVGVK